MITERKEQLNDVKTPRFYGKTQRAADLVVKHGVEPREALLIANNGKLPDRSNIARFKEKCAKYSLSSPKMEKKAYNLLNQVLEMRPLELKQQTVNRQGEVVEYTETIAPTFTNGLAAAAMVFDRTQGIVNKSLNVNASVSISPVDLTQFLAK